MEPILFVNTGILFTACFILFCDYSSITSKTKYFVYFVFSFILYVFGFWTYQFKEIEIEKSMITNTFKLDKIEINFCKPVIVVEKMRYKQLWLYRKYLYEISDNIPEKSPILYINGETH